MNWFSLLEDKKEKQDEPCCYERLEMPRGTGDSCMLESGISMQPHAEEYSEILMKEKSRKLTKVELDAKVTKRRQYVSIETIDSKQ